MGKRKYVILRTANPPPVSAEEVEAMRERLEGPQFMAAKCGQHYNAYCSCCQSAEEMSNNLINAEREDKRTLLALLATLAAENEAVKRRAVAAEEDWQAAEARVVELEALLERKPVA